MKNVIRKLRHEVNIAAIEEYERVSKRYEFLINQKNDLYQEKHSFLNIIKEMDLVMKDCLKQLIMQLVKSLKWFSKNYLVVEKLILS